MKHRIVTAAQMKEIEQAGDAHGLPYLQMMENAGLAAYAELQKQFPHPGRLLVVCGKPPLLPDSGDNVTSTVYCLGILRAIITPTIAPIPATFSSIFRAAHNLRTYSIKSISNSSSSRGLSVLFV